MGYLQGSGPIRQVETCPDLFFHCKSTHTVKILADNTHCKYFLKIAEVTHFSVLRRVNRKYVTVYFIALLEDGTVDVQEDAQSSSLISKQVMTQII
jgi:hypothetical protein